MNLDDLRAVQSEERRADSLQSLRDEFYRDVASYIEELREERARAAERAEDPFGSEEVRRLTDEIETAEEVAEAVYERRVGKVVKRASLAAAGMPTDEEGLTAEEQELFADLVEQIETHRSKVLAAFAGEGEDAAPTGSESSSAVAADQETAVTNATGAEPEPTVGDGSRVDPAPPEPEGNEREAAAITAGGEGETADAAEEHAPDLGDGGFDAAEAMGADATTGSSDDPEQGSRNGDPVEGTIASTRTETDARDGETTVPEPDGGTVTADPPASGPPGSATPAEEGVDSTAATGGTGSASDDSPATPETGGTSGETAGADGTSASNAGDDRTTVRITREVGEIFGLDERAYHLESGDVVTLPDANAESLIERDAARKL